MAKLYNYGILPPCTVLAVNRVQQQSQPSNCFKNASNTPVRFIHLQTSELATSVSVWLWPSCLMRMAACTSLSRHILGPRVSSA